MPLVDEIGGYLSAAGIATTSAGSTGWRLQYRGLVPQPGRQVAVIPTGGFQQEGKAPLNRPTFQILVQGSSNAGSELEEKVEDIQTALNLFAGTLSGRVYVDIQMQGDAAFLGWDEHQSPLYSLNFLALRSRTT